jgi:hypothetical protein
VRVLASLGLVGIQQAVPGPLPLSLLVCVLAAVVARWALAALRS